MTEAFTDYMWQMWSFPDNGDREGLWDTGYLFRTDATGYLRRFYHIQLDVLYCIFLA